MADNINRNLKNPLLSANVTGFSIDDFTQNPVLIPVQPKPTIAPKEQSVTALRNINDESFSEISLDSDNQDNAPISNQEEIKNPLLDLDSTAGSLPQAPRLSSTTSSTFSQVSNQASQFGAQLSQLPSVASSVLSSFSNILGRASGPSNNQPKEADVYRSPLDNLLNNSGDQGNGTSVPPANQNNLTGLDQTRPPSTSGVAPPPPVPLFSAGQISQPNEQKLPPTGNSFRLGGIKKKTYAQIPGLNTLHVNKLVDSPLQPNPPLPSSSQQPSAPFFNPQPLNTVTSGSSSQTIGITPSQTVAYFQPPQQSTDKCPTGIVKRAQILLETSRIQQESSISHVTTTTPDLTPLPVNRTQTSTVRPDLPLPPPLVSETNNSNNIPSVSTFFAPPQQYSHVTSGNTQPIPTQYQPPSSISQQHSAPPFSSATFTSAETVVVNKPPPHSIPFFTSSGNVQQANSGQQQLICNLPKSNYPSVSSNLPHPQPVDDINSVTSTQSNISCAPSSTSNTPPIHANILPPPPPPTKSSLNVTVNANLSQNTQNSVLNRNPFSIHSITKNRTSSVPVTENISIFNPNFVKPSQPSGDIETRKLPQVPANKPVFNPPLYGSHTGLSQDNRQFNTQPIKPPVSIPVNKIPPYLTVSPESEQHVLKNYTPANVSKPATAPINLESDKGEQVTSTQNFPPNDNKSNPPSQSNSRKSSVQESQSASSYFIQDRNPKSFPSAPPQNLVNPIAEKGQSFFSDGNDVNIQETNVINQQTSNAAQSSQSHLTYFPQNTRVTSVTSNSIRSFPHTTFGNMDNNAANEPLIYEPVTHHWFHKREVDSKVIWTPFSLIDSAALEKAFHSGLKNAMVATDGGRYDVNVTERTRCPVYWPGEITNVRRCSWFFKAIDSRFMPYEEHISDLLEAEYRNCSELNTWHRRIELPNEESVMLHGPNVLVHFLRGAESQDGWTNGTQTANRPRIVKRGVQDFELDKGEPTKVDHLLFLVHGIGSVCDLKFRTVEEVVDEFRGISLQLVQSHYRSACESGLVNRVEVLPVSWHGSLHSSETGIDDKLKAITLESIPKLREFTNGTLLDVLFYTSPVYCQTIMQTVGNELNRLYSLFLQRNPGYKGGVSLGGHSLGSLILFDLLCHQTPPEETKAQNSTDSEMEFQEDDKIAPLTERKPLKRALSKRINYVIGHAGTGQPFIKYPQLLFHPNTFFALGSPLGMFVTIRGIDTLGLDFALPTCPGFFNIFHPYDPVAYRVEALINPALKNVRPVLIPHHKGRKRMHLELKETMSRVGADLKNRLMDSVKNTWNSVYQIAMFKGTQTLDDVVDKALRQELQMKYSSTNSLDSDGENKVDEHLDEASLPLGKLNQGRRVDYVLQEAPLEFFNEYIFALTSHVCYWESEDTMLIIIKEIYSSLGATTDSQIPQQTMTIERPVYTQNNHMQQQNPVESGSSNLSSRPEMSSVEFSK